MLLLGLGACVAFFVIGWLVAVRVGAHQHRAALQRLNRVQDHFISTASHELRTPLTSIHGSLGLLAAGLLDGDPQRAKAMLRIASANAERLARVVNDLVLVERIASGRLALDLRACSASELVHRAVAGLSDQAEQQGIRVEVEARVEPDVRVRADAERLSTALSNLIDNGLKFSPPGSTIRIAIYGGDASDEDVHVSVSDQGIGIAPDQLDVIFERFRQLDTSDSRRTAGAGLGLAIAKSIVEAHSGSIRATSLGEGLGSTFALRLPRWRGRSVPVQRGGDIAGEPQRIERFGQHTRGAELQQRSTVG
jgi:signal transduction histidine kinase